MFIDIIARAREVEYMFEIQYLKGNTYCISAPTNMGLYKLDEKSCILIDTCNFGKTADTLLKTLEHEGLQIKAVFNTHGHIDHFGANQALSEKYGAMITAPPFENTFIEHPDLYAFLLLPFIPFSFDKNNYLPKGVHTGPLLETPKYTFKNTDFDIIPLHGHTPNHVGIATPDNVIFVGDAFIGQTQIEHLKIYYNQDVFNAIDSMRFLLKTNYDYYVPSHGEPVTSIETVIEKNLESIYASADQIYEILSKQPLSTDEIMERFSMQLDISTRLVEYYIAQACVMGLLAFLEKTQRIQTIFDNGILKFTILQ
jgi:glyoxylase-like metal-dependent hydrolase (beta-lactamase superfamily II)